ncbi:hypothetical protein BDP27DRAFT_1313494 [Rhodocollybia butyracea]|uniref:Uncharacterized protein n=1 Tax=Rhodocollybia butyracea TaxID=206335 RepID=A0A9P5Q1D7_9AGAR|nr:hypothetical protein BDP27DRAFT_1313494 [Rhodocollybia butyracea]
MSTQTKQPKDMSQDAFVKYQGFRNFPEFMLSYGLKIYNLDDVEEAKSILAGLRQAAQEQWEEENEKTR